MAHKLLSISLGSEIVKVCEISLAGKNKVQVYNAIDLIIPEGLCDDGVIQNVGALASTIKEGLSGEGFSAKKIVFALNSKRIANKEALIPYCKPNRIKDIVTINATEYFPIANLDNYTINYSVLEVVDAGNVKNYRLSVTATPNEMIEQYYSLAKAMGMSVEFLDYSGNAILQLLKLQTAGEGVDAILQFSGENTVVNIMNGETMIMQRSVPYGRSSIADAVMSFQNCSDEEADEILATEDIEDLANSSEDVADAVRAFLSSVSRILEFYRNKNPEQPIEHIYMIGDVSSVNGLVDLINSESDSNVEVIESLRGVEIKNHSTINEEIAANYLANIGAVLNPINIRFEQDKKGSRGGKASLPWWMLIFSGAIAAIMVGGILFVYNDAQAENDNIRAQIDSLGDFESLQHEYERSQADLQVMVDWYDTTKSSNESLYKLICDLETVQPAAVAITHLTSKESIVSIQGEAYGKPSIAEFVIQLKKLPYVSDVKTDVIIESIEDYAAKDNFTLSFKLNYDDPQEEPKATPYISNSSYNEETSDGLQDSDDFAIGDDGAVVMQGTEEDDDEPLEVLSIVSEGLDNEGGEQ